MVFDHARTIKLARHLLPYVLTETEEPRHGQDRLEGRSPRALIDPAFLADPEDLEVLLAGFKITRRVMQAPALSSWVTRDMLTGNVHSDDDIRSLLRERVDTVYHPVGTCRMGVDEDAVVDPELRVRGVDGLRVVDASIMPTLIGGNTNAASIMIAEKAADMIRGRAALSPIQLRRPELATPASVGADRTSLTTV
jgi:choline dehydrogenase-like flavoprotein